MLSNLGFHMQFVVRLHFVPACLFIYISVHPVQIGVSCSCVGLQQAHLQPADRWLVVLRDFGVAGVTKCNKWCCFNKENSLPEVSRQVLVVQRDLGAAGVAEAGRVRVLLQAPDRARVLVRHLPAPLVQLLWVCMTESSRRLRIKVQTQRRP